MKEDSKALRAAKILCEYCNERICGECIFQSKSTSACRVLDVIASGNDFNNLIKEIKIKPNLNDTMAGKIRKLLSENPNAGRKELEEIFGEIKRSIVVTFYNEARLMYGRSGSLKTGIRKKREDEHWERVSKYFEQNPNTTLKDACIGLGTSYKTLLSYLHTKRREGKTVEYEKLNYMRGRMFGKTKQIYEFFKKNPLATVTECAEKMGIDPKYVSTRRWALQKKGLLDK